VGLGRKSPTSILRKLTGTLDHNNCSANRFAKKILFTLLSNDKKCSRLRQSQAKKIRKRYRSCFATNKEWLLPNRNNLQQKQYSPHSNFEYNNQNLKIIYPFLSVS